MSGKVKITPTRLKYSVNSGYECYGAYTHLNDCRNESSKVVKKFTKTLFFDDPLRLSVPYNYFVGIDGEPPDNACWCFLVVMGIIGIFAVVLVSAAMRIHIHAVNSSGSPPRSLRVSLATNDLQEGTTISFSFDSDGIPSIIDNSATCCIICNDRAQFTGNLRAEKLSVKTTHGLASTNYVGTISITIIL